MLAWKSTDCHGAVFGTFERELNERLPPLWFLANDNNDRKQKEESKWRAVASSSSVLRFNQRNSGLQLQGKVVRPLRVSLWARDGLFLSASPVDLATRTQTAFNLPRCFTLAVMLTKYPFQPPSAPCLSVCPSVCVSVSLFRGLFLSVSLPPKLVSQLLLTPRDKAVPVVTSADTTQGTHARAFACVRLAHAPLTYLLGGRWR